MDEIAIYGASGFGREVAWLVEACLGSKHAYKPVCFIDDNNTKQGENINGLPILSLDQAKNQFPSVSIVAGIGIPRIREQIVEKTVKVGFNFANIIHPRVEMSRWVVIGEGVVICAGNILTTNITLGNYVQLNLDCTIGHDVVIGNFTTLSPGVHVSGWVHFGKRAYVGTGAVFINGTKDRPIEIGDDAIIGAGACVTKSVPSGETWGGVPAKELKNK